MRERRFSGDRMAEARAAIAERLRAGEVLIKSDIIETCDTYRVNPQAIIHINYWEKFPHVWVGQGEKYRGRYYYFDRNLPPEKLAMGIRGAKAKIDAEIDGVSKKVIKTIAARNKRLTQR